MWNRWICSLVALVLCMVHVSGQWLTGHLVHNTAQNNLQFKDEPMIDLNNLKLELLGSSESETKEHVDRGVKISVASESASSRLRNDNLLSNLIDTFSVEFIAPSEAPTAEPTQEITTTDFPTFSPTYEETSEPSFFPTEEATNTPSEIPTVPPSYAATDIPTVAPTTMPTTMPTDEPTAAPSVPPSEVPTVPPTLIPTGTPTVIPTVAPTTFPTWSPSNTPTAAPTTFSPSVSPTVTPSAVPTMSPTTRPSAAPTASPTVVPTAIPSTIPTAGPTQGPTVVSTQVPSVTPTFAPSAAPSEVPTLSPSALPTVAPTTSAPTFAPSPVPSPSPTLSPSRFPTRLPTAKPTVRPSIAPSLAVGETDKPTVAPTAAPTYSTQYYWEQYFTTVKSSIGSSDSSDVVYRASYSELRDVANSKVISGSCSTWKNFITTDLTVAKTSYLPSSIQLIESSTLDASVSSSTTLCSNDTAAQLIVSTILSPSSTATSIMCSSSQTWVVQNCTAGVAVCVGCSNPCTETSDSLRIAPCGSTATSFSSYVIRSLSVGYGNFPGIPDITDVYITSATSTSVTIATTLSDSGSLYVGIYRHFASPASPSSVESVILQNHPATYNSDTGNYTVTINGLLAATDYSLFFVTLSTFGLKSTLTTTLSTQVNVTTACCRDFIVSISASSILEEVNVLNFLTQQVSASPQTNLYSVYTLYSIDTSALTSSQYASNPFSPASMTVVGGKGVSKISSSASLLKLPTGTYGITVALVGTNADDYSITYSGGLSTYSSSFSDMLIFSVLSSESPLPAPVLSSATFSSDGSYVQVAFDKDTDKGGLANAFTCSSIFSFSCASASTCYWVDSATINAYVSTGDSCLAPANSLTLLNTTSLRAKCPKSSGTCTTQSSWPKAVTKSVTVGKSSSSISPTVSLSMPSTMGSCATLTLDAGSSSGNGGRSWSNVSIVATAMDSTGTSQSVTSLNSYLTSNFVASSPLTLESSYFTAGLAYNFQVTLCNFLGKCSSSNKRVSVVANAVPLITISGSSLRTTKKSDALSIVSKGSMPSTCSSSDTISYTWATYIGTALQTALTSTGKNPSRFVLSAYSLAVNTMYTMKVTATASSTGTSSSTSVQVYVTPGDVNIVLSKSSSTYSVQRGSSLTIDASSSYDEDISSLTGVDAGLQFYWSCLETSPNLISNCTTVFTEEVDTGDLLSGYTSALKLYARDDLLSSADDTVITTQVTLTIYDSSFSRSDTVAITVYVLPTLSPVISLSYTSSFSDATVLNKINADDTLTITGTILSPASLSATMNYSLDSATSSLVDLSASSLTPIKKFYSAASSNATATVTSYVYLALPANVLTAGVSYTFYLSAYLQSPGQSASSSITIKVNAEPTPGYFTVTPESGTAMDTTFTFLCERWIDEDLPLTYLFGYQSAGEQNVMIRVRSETSYAEKQLAAGLKVNDYVLITLAYIYDAYDASITVYDSNIIEENSAISDSDISDFVESTYSSIATADIDDIKQNVALSHYLLNMVNCTLAPNCTKLNRMECYRTAQTCGPCRSDDYIGDKGDANTMCYTDISDVTVTTTLKTCGDDCSGNGECRFYLLQNDEEIDTCYEGEVDCYAACDCNDGYTYSLTCSRSDSDIETKRDQRKQLFSAFQSSLGKEDVTADSFRTWLATIVEVSQNPEEISEDLVTILTSILSTLLDSAKSVGATNSEISNIILALRSLTKATEMNAQASEFRRRLSESSDVNVTVVQTKNSLKTYADYVSGNLVPGQDPVEFVKDGFRIYVEKFDVSDYANSTLSSSSCDANVTISMPQTAAEIASGLDPSTFTIPTCSSSGESELTVTSVILSKAQYESSVNSNNTVNSDVFSMFFSEYPCFDTDSCYASFVIQRTYSVNDSATPTRMDTTCESGDYNTYLVECSATETFNVTCNGTASIITTICPLTSYTQECDAIYGIDVRDVGCSIESFSATNITCRCPLYTDYDSANATRRRLSGSIPSGEVSSSFANMLESSTTGVEYSIELISEVDDAVNGFEVYVTVSVLFLSTIIILYYAFMWDQKDRHSYYTSKFNFLHSRSAYLEGIFGTGKAPYITEGTANTSETKVAPLRKRKRDPRTLVYRVPSAKAHETEDILAMADEALPKILSSKSFMLRILTELVHEHRWLNVIFHFDESFTRPLRVFALFTNLMMIFFVLSFTFHYTETSGKEECNGYETSTDCAEQSSSYLTGQAMCYWDGDTDSCKYQHPESMERILLVVAVFAALVTYPCFYIVNNMIVRDILAAPTWEKDGPNQLVEPSVDYFYPDRDQQLLNDGPNAAAGGVMTTTNSAVGLSHVDLLNNEHNDSKSSADEVPTTRPTVDMVDVYVAAQSEYQHLSLELLHYRSDLTAEERRTFDVHWGLNIDGHFRGDEKKFPTNVSVTVPWCHFNETIPVALRVQADVRYAIQNHFLEASKNKLNGLNDRMKSIRLLYWFQLDLMSKTNAFIVNRKNSREMHCLTLRPVYGITKTLAWTFLWSLNIGMLFFTLWFAVRKDKDLEQAWARSFAAYLVLDMIFTASVSVLIQHVLIPLTASREIDHIKETLIETLMHYNKDNHRGSKRVSDIEQNNAYLNISSFNAAKFIFVSSRLAVEYANLKVAKIISSYRTTSPTLPYNFYTPALVREFASGVCNLPTKTLMYYVSMPSLLQDLIMHIVFTCLMGYMFFYLIQLFDQEQAYIAITILIFGAFALIVYVYCASKQPYDLRHNIIFEEIQDDDVDANNKDQNSYSSRKVAKGSPNLAPLASS